VRVAQKVLEIGKLRVFRQVACADQNLRVGPKREADRIGERQHGVKRNSDHNQPEERPRQPATHVFTGKRSRTHSCSILTNLTYKRVKRKIRMKIMTPTADAYPSFRLRTSVL